MKLTVKERIMALDILPREGDFLTLKALRELREALSLNDDEVKRFGVTLKQQGNGTIDYSWEVNGEAELPLNEAKRELIRLPLRTLDGQKMLTEDLVSLYEKFVITKDDEDKRAK